MRQSFIVMVLMLVLVTGCRSSKGPFASPVSPTSSPPITQPSSSKPKKLAAMTLSTELQQTVLNAVGQQQNLPPEQLQIVRTVEMDWPDACLGLAAAGEFCAQMLTPGWAVTVTNGTQTWQYRIDLDATQVKLEK